MLIISTLVLLAAPLLEVRAEGRVGPRGVAGFPLPPACMSKEWLGMDCPGCGLTRSFIHLAHGDWASSLRIHRAGWILAIATLLQIPYRLHALFGSGRWLLSPIATKAVQWGLISVLILNWLFNIVAHA
jgi:hypothetical protein